MRFWIIKGKWNELKYIPAGPPCNKGEFRLPFLTVGWELNTSDKPHYPNNLSDRERGESNG
jgi:hypothetical protein